MEVLFRNRTKYNSRNRTNYNSPVIVSTYSIMAGRVDTNDSSLGKMLLFSGFPRYTTFSSPIILYRLQEKKCQIKNKLSSLDP